MRSVTVTSLRIYVKGTHIPKHGEGSGFDLYCSLPRQDPKDAGILRLSAPFVHSTKPPVYKQIYTPNICNSGCNTNFDRRYGPGENDLESVDTT